MGDVAVLVVDDHAPFRTAMRAILARTAGFSLVGEAVDGTEVVGAVAATNADLVLMDVNMPLMDGLGATRALLEERPATVVFLCSTYSFDDLPAAAGTTGARAYVHKKDLSPQLLIRLWTAVATAAPGDDMLIG